MLFQSAAGTSCSVEDDLTPQTSLEIVTPALNRHSAGSIPIRSKSEPEYETQNDSDSAIMLEENFTEVMPVLFFCIISLSLCLYISLPPSPPVSLFSPGLSLSLCFYVLCFSVGLFLCFSVSPSLSLSVSQLLISL